MNGWVGMYIGNILYNWVDIKIEGEGKKIRGGAGKGREKRRGRNGIGKVLSSPSRIVWSMV